MPRKYASVYPGFWTGETGKQLRELGRNEQLLALYLVSSPLSNMIGLYYLPLPTIVHETGISQQGVAKGLQRLSELQFAHYDQKAEHIWVPEMARYQLAPALQEGDNKVKGVERELQNYIKSPFAPAFIARYSEPYHLDAESLLKEIGRGLEAPLEPPSEGLLKGPCPVSVNDQVSADSGKRDKIPPKREEVAAYAKEIGLGEGEVDKFMNHYQSVGWVVGKDKKMKDWRASLRGWNDRSKTWGNDQSGVVFTATQYPSEDADDIEESRDNRAAAVG